VEQIAKASLLTANRFGVHLLELGRYEDASRVFEQLTGIYPQSGTLWYNRARACQSSGQPDAKRFLDRARFGDPANAYSDFTHPPKANPISTK
jgi:tetratricopeptide (TPR) repeat protein